MFATHLAHFENHLGQSLCLRQMKEVTRWPWTFWILVNTLQNRCVKSKGSVVDHVMMDLKSMHQDVKIVQGSERNAVVYGGVVDDGVAPSRKART